jgi:catechol 2,3-dioxygenase-like lactoylglutathione lyase family enzyme
MCYICSMDYLTGVDSLMLYVSDVKASAEFYESLGFTPQQIKKDFAAVKLGDFELHFHDKNLVPGPYFRQESLAEPKGAGLYIYVGVREIDAYYRTLIDKGIVTSTEPRDWPWGNREFVVRDLDKYKIVFYEKL